MFSMTIAPYLSSVPVLILGLIAWTVLNRRLWVRGPINKPAWMGPDPIIGLFVLGAFILTTVLNDATAQSETGKHIGSALIGLITIFASLKFWKSATGHLPFRDDSNVMDVSKSFLHIATLFPLLMIAGAINVKYLEGNVDMHPLIDEILNNRPSPWAFAGYVGLIVLIAPVVEEILFRGLLQSGFERILGFLPALIFQCALFALIHPVYSRLPLLIFAIGLTLVTRWSGSLIPAIVMHAAFNAINMLELSIATYGPWWSAVHPA